MRGINEIINATVLIPLTQGYFAWVDIEGWDLVKNHKWFLHRGHNGSWYAETRILIDEKLTNILMHRLIMDAKRGQQVDHINGNKLDNRKCNLRFCTNAQNAMNSFPRIGTTSKYKGVGWSKIGNKWRAYIGINGKYIHLGYFSVEEDAALSYNKAAKVYFGDFALINNLEDS
jgi:hypothetical protein